MPPKLKVTFMPEELNNEHIQEIGDKYLKKYGARLQKQQLSLFSQHLQIANVLKTYNNNSPALTKWLYLANLYAQLGNHKNEIAHAIEKLFHAAFADKIKDLHNLHNLHNNQVKSVQDLSGIFLAVSNDYFYNDFMVQKSLYINTCG